MQRVREKGRFLHALLKNTLQQFSERDGSARLQLVAEKKNTLGRHERDSF
jgi:hypothetical protein